LTRTRIEDITKAIEEGYRQFRAIMDSDPEPFFVDECYDLSGSEPPEDPEKRTEEETLEHLQMRMDVEPDGTDVGREEPSAGPMTDDPTGRIGMGDNLRYMNWLLKEKDMAGKIQLIYVDPPFFSGSRYQVSVQIESRKLGRSPVIRTGAYDDDWGNDLQEYLTMLAVRFYMMKELLSDRGCLWVHLDWHGAHYVKIMLDEIFGMDRLVNEVIWTYKSGGASKRSFARKHDTLFFYSKTKDYKFNPIQEKSYNRQGKPYRFKGVEEFEDDGGWYTMVNMKDVWNIDMVGRTSSERMGYATQKPEKLLARIVEACSDPGDICADFFAGTGTLGVVSSDLGRPWIMCDEGGVAVADQIYRMSSREGTFLVERPKKTGRPSKFPRAEVAFEDNYLRLADYRPDISVVREEDRQIVLDYMMEDNLSLVRFWSCCETGDASAPTAGGPSIHFSNRLLSRDDLHDIKSSGASIIGYDIFGGRFHVRMGSESIASTTEDVEDEV